MGVICKKITTNWGPSNVDVFTGNSELDDKDLNLVAKRYDSQRPAIHEFGHMLGLDDEYIKGSIWIKDKNSVMNNGEVIKGRHLTYFYIWLNKKLAKHRIQ